MKSLRHDKILEIISSRNVETQEELSDALREVGIVATQATISRDIKELRLQKILTPDGSYRYSAPNRRNDMNIDLRLQTIFRESVTSVEAAGNLVVIKTLPGLANAACSAVDSMELDDVLGTLAGDDTGIIIAREEKFAGALKEKFLQLMK